MIKWARIYEYKRRKILTFFLPDLYPHILRMAGYVYRGNEGHTRSNGPVTVSNLLWNQQISSSY